MQTPQEREKRPEKTRSVPFSESGRQVMLLSRKAAERFNHSYIGTEHMLLALTEEETTRKLFQDMDINPDEIRLSLESKTPPFDNPFNGEPMITPMAKKVIQRAPEIFSLEEIRALDLLIAIILEDEGIAAETLKEFKLEKNTLRQAMAVTNATADILSKKAWLN